MCENLISKDQQFGRCGRKLCPYFARADFGCVARDFVWTKIGAVFWGSHICLEGPNSSPSSFKSDCSLFQQRGARGCNAHIYTSSFCLSFFRQVVNFATWERVMFRCSEFGVGYLG